jgi:hypothetical protein
MVMCFEVPGGGTMFESTVLDVAVGLIFVFLTVSLICGVLTEILATVFSWRANTLLAGVRQMVNDPKFDSLARHLYNHALVNPRGPGVPVNATPEAATAAAVTNKPAYIDPLHFAGAMLDTIKVVAGSKADMQAAIAASPLLAGNNQMTTMLSGMADRADGSIDAMRKSLAGWFDAGMDRVSGTYKRWTQIYCFGFGVLIAVGLNIDTLRVTSALWRQPQITQSLKASMDPADVATRFQSLGLPIGWGTEGTQISKADFGCFTRVIEYAALLIGWLITALSTLFGASFWFDALSGVLKIRGSGPSPPDNNARA